MATRFGSAGGEPTGFGFGSIGMPSPFPITPENSAPVQQPVNTRLGPFANVPGFGQGGLMAMFESQFAAPATRFGDSRMADGSGNPYSLPQLNNPVYGPAPVPPPQKPQEPLLPAPDEEPAPVQPDPVKHKQPTYNQQSVYSGPIYSGPSFGFGGY